MKQGTAGCRAAVLVLMAAAAVLPQLAAAQSILSPGLSQEQVRSTLLRYTPGGVQVGRKAMRARELQAQTWAPKRPLGSAARRDAMTAAVLCCLHVAAGQPAGWLLAVPEPHAGHLLPLWR